MSDDGHLRLIGSESFRAQEIYRVVTFLNQCLKQQGLIFGLTRVDDTYNLKVYTGRRDDAPLVQSTAQNQQEGGEA